VLEWIRDWYILACDGEKRYIRLAGSAPVVPGQTISFSVPTAVPPLLAPESWRAPAWLFLVAPEGGIRLLRSEHVPARDSEQRLGAAHTRLLLKAARRVFLRVLAEAIERVRNEETAAASAIPAVTVGNETGQRNSRPKNWLKGTEGLVRKADFSPYMSGLTEKQQLAFSLKYEYELGLTEIASRMGLNHKTAYDHIEAAKRKVDQTISSERRKATRAKDAPE
jgi:DNA-directed RNA polymerase specialized sigma24 family protein